MSTSARPHGQRSRSVSTSESDGRATHEHGEAIDVLLVEDTDHVRQMIATILELDGFAVTAVPSGEEAIAAVSRSEPVVAVVDHMMPGMHGLAVAEALLTMHPELPIILYSAFLDDDVQATATEIGVTACIGKTEGVDALSARDPAGRRRRSLAL